VNIRVFCGEHKNRAKELWDCPQNSEINQEISYRVKYKVEDKSVFRKNSLKILCKIAKKYDGQYRRIK
jgi:hypothetical protein